MSTFNSATFNLTKKFLALEITNNGGFSTYSTTAKSGHVYYSNNIYDPWGNNKTYLGSFDLKSVGNTTLVFGNQIDAIGTTLQNKQRYTDYPTLYNSRDSNEPFFNHFLTIVIDRPKPSDYNAPSNPASFTFLDGYGHAGIEMNLRPYYLTETGLASLQPISYQMWDGGLAESFNDSFSCNFRGDTPYSGRFPETANYYNDNNAWMNSSYVMPPHGCQAVGPTTTWLDGCRYYPSIVGYQNNPKGCVPAVFMRYNVSAAPTCSVLGTIDTSYKVTVYRDGPNSTQFFRINGTYGNTTLPIVGGCSFSAAAYQSSCGPTGFYYALPTWQPDVAFRCNRGAKTSTMNPYYSAGSTNQYGGYGFYVRFNFDPVCLPCSYFY
jgi:hypothetical protein